MTTMDAVESIAGTFGGRHVLAELHGIDAALLIDESNLRTLLGDALKQAGATVCGMNSKSFDPPGVTVLALLSESHASVHTYPAEGAAFVDVFTCGDRADPELAVHHLADALGASTREISTIDRGRRPERSILEPMSAGLDRRWDLAEVIFSGRTAYQELVIARTTHGVTLFCDDERQSSELSQLVYHEALMVPALLLADRVDRVLIIGSSEGVASQIAAAAGGRVDHVDIDEECVRACAEHLPYGYDVQSLAEAECGDGAVRMIYADGWQFLADAARGTDRYDVVVVDRPDERPEHAQHNRPYGAEFLQMCRAVLTQGGVIVNQAGCPTLWRNDTLIRSWQRFDDNFESVFYYGSDEHEWAFLFGHDGSGTNQAERMEAKLPHCGYRPVTIDALALRGNSIPPYHVRHEGVSGAASAQGQ